MPVPAPLELVPLPELAELDAELVAEPPVPVEDEEEPTPAPEPDDDPDAPVPSAEPPPPHAARTSAPAAKRPPIRSGVTTFRRSCFDVSCWLFMLRDTHAGYAA